ncbi:MAG: methionine--tRNA ligase [Candidatus Marinimicrobia bacterium]|jgi:methionyl-tRNA synthetase|nr:methionine--tRNA ligase [Candidatus Neomarinimicrobiota bacterium]MBT3496554.1 methionine--tRNA ligase [Candidatus Neomarinimicrobiota bacterium]MBT3692341.1 methionine--tRNA ligase [Candidatus Neomarinimicrobiota bacterium]MBT3731487.1 methionine--tRNA ligase [Candidatus Neomarinimicrobiota bacterium]MBT4144902.1 methionine--tRNA ligase [Candidatus Neomarinimicrobiota bacterium]
MNDKFYISTPIYYVNDKPHIGHAYTTILADVLSRFHRNRNEETFFLTGLDEHGQKVEQAASARDVNPQQHCDEMAPRFTKLWEELHISNNDFIRTTESRHKKVVQEILQKVWDAGDIYEAEYEGLYSVSEERFVTEKEVESGDYRDIQTLKEKNYFFKMSKYQQKLIDHIESNPDFIRPEHRKNEILGFLKNPLNDLCISRPKSRMSWGIDLPFDDNYVTYVWFDALINYVTAIGYGADSESFKKWWPANMHLIGKDILTTHAVYWPTMLMSLGIDLPKTIFAHGWWLMKDSKMSKSLGNVVNPMDLISDYGVDPVRYYLMREMVLGQDANFTIDSFIKRYNADLANDLGNLLSRVSNLIVKNFEGKTPDPGTFTSQESELIEKANQFETLISEKIDEMKIHDAIEETLQFVRSVNRYLEETAPWKLVKEDKKSAARVLYSAAETLRISAIILEPIMPNRMEDLLASLGTKNKTLIWGELEIGSTITKGAPLFPRIQV